MRRLFLSAQSRGIEAEKKTLLIASLRLVLYFLLLSFSLSEILLITGDSAIYSGKEQFIAWHLSFSAFSLGLIIDASYVLGKNRQSAAMGNRKGIVGAFLETFVLILSPMPLLGLVIIGAAVGLLWTAMSFLTVIF